MGIGKPNYNGNKQSYCTAFCKIKLGKNTQNNTGKITLIRKENIPELRSGISVLCLTDKHKRAGQEMN